MKKQQTQLIGVLVILAVALAAFFGLRAMNTREGDDRNKDAVSLIDFDLSKVDRIKVFDPAKDDGLIQYRYELLYRTNLLDDVASWYMSESVHQSTTPKAKADTVKQMLDEISQLKGHKPITNVTDFAQYGLDPPSLIIWLYVSGEGQIEEHPTVIEIGDLSTGASMYYARVYREGEEDYTVYLITTMVKSLFDVEADSLILSDE